MLFLTHYFDVLVALNDVVCITLSKSMPFYRGCNSRNESGFPPLVSNTCAFTSKCYQYTVRFLTTEAAHKANNINNNLVY